MKAKGPDRVSSFLNELTFRRSVISMSQNLFIVNSLLNLAL